MNNYLIPLVNIPQTFLIALAGTNYSLTVKWNDIGQVWILDVADGASNPLAAGMPFVTGADLLDGLEYLGINGQLIAYTNGLPFDIPTLDNLGGDSNLYFQSSVAPSGT